MNEELKMSTINRNSELFNKILGCLAGGALGDSIGGVTEMMHYKTIERLFGWVDQPMPTGKSRDTARFSPGLPAGAYTDDTRLKHLLCEAIIVKGGRVTADDLATIWLEKMTGWYYYPVINAYHKIFHGDARPREAGQGCMASNSTAMSIAPIGIINACNPAQAAQDAYDVASIIHEGDARDGAIAIATAVAEAFNPDTNLDKIIKAATDYLYPKGTMVKLIHEAVEMARNSNSFEEFRETFYNSMLIPTPQGVGIDTPPKGFYDTAEPREGIPAAIALCYLGKGNWRKTVEYCANFGRDSDTLGSMAGSILGAYEGATGIPKEWIDMLPIANPEAPNLLELSDQMGNALLKNISEIRINLDKVDSLMN